jgi:hypothetical protein
MKRDESRTGEPAIALPVAPAVWSGRTAVLEAPCLSVATLRDGHSKPDSKQQQKHRKYPHEQLCSSRHPMILVRAALPLVQAVSVGFAAEMLVTAGDDQTRIRSQAAFAKMWHGPMALAMPNPVVISRTPSEPTTAGLSVDQWTHPIAPNQRARAQACRPAHPSQKRHWPEPKGREAW